MRDQALRKRLAEADSCPSCGRDAAATASGHCVHCLQPIGQRAGHGDPASILKLVEFERARGNVRSTGGRRRVRIMARLLIWGSAALVLVLLFELSLRWMVSFFARGVVKA